MEKIFPLIMNVLTALANCCTTLHRKLSLIYARHLYFDGSCNMQFT